MIEITKEMIGCLCWFDYSDKKVVGILKEVQVNENNTTYIDDRGISHNSCKLYPFEDELMKTYFKGIEDGRNSVDKGYEIICLQGEKDELLEKVQALEEENQKLRSKVEP